MAQLAFFLGFMAALIVPQLALCWYLKGRRVGLGFRAWLQG